METDVLLVGSWQEPVYLVLTFDACVLQAVRGSRTEETAQDWCRWKNSASGVVQVADGSQSNHVEPNRQEQHRRRLELRGTQWLAHGYVSRLTGQSIVASIETGQLEHGHETVLELVGQ